MGVHLCHITFGARIVITHVILLKRSAYSKSQQDYRRHFWHGYVLREEGIASYSSHSVSHKVLHQRTASHSSHTSHSVSHKWRHAAAAMRAHNLLQGIISHQKILYHTYHVSRIVSYILHLTPYTLHLTSYVLRLTSYILHLTPYTLRLTSYILYLISYRILYRVTFIRLVCKTYPWSDASTIRQKL
jgi:hypothetical protein